ncbi:THUMP-like domain-containing protein [Kytococcus sp. Marseille-QA3725]
MTDTPTFDEDALDDAGVLHSVAPGTDPALDALVDEVTGAGADDLQAAARLRAAGVGPRRAAAALSQAELRAAGGAKFGDRADSLLLTRAGLEQATRWQVARLHAERFASAGIGHVTDVGCGLGADSHAIAEAVGAVTAVEADAVTAAAAAHNLRPAGVEVVQAEADATLRPPEGIDPGDWGLWFDPARRTGVADAHGRARRVSGPGQLRPSLDLVLELASRAALTGCKVGPGWRHADIPPGADAQWVSHDGDLVEAVLWVGVGTSGTRSATRLAADGTVLAQADSSALTEGPVGAPAHPVLTSEDDLGTHLWEPDPALAQAGLVGLLAHDGAAETGPGVGWLTADRPGEGPWVRNHRVLEVLPPRPKQLNAWARRCGVGELVLRKHGSAVDPTALRRRLRTSGTQRAVLLLTRIGDRQVAVHLTP